MSKTANKGYYNDRHSDNFSSFGTPVGKKKDIKEKKINGASKK